MDRVAVLEEVSEDFQKLQRTWKHYFHVALGNEQLSPAQMGILFYLKRHQPATGKQIAQLIQISPSAVTQLIDALDKLGYVTRKSDTVDRRVTYIMLSDLALERIAQLEKRHKQFFAEATENLTDEELELMKVVQKKMMQQMEHKIGDKK